MSQLVLLCCLALPYLINVSQLFMIQQTLYRQIKCQDLLARIPNVGDKMRCAQVGIFPETQAPPNLSKWSRHSPLQKLDCNTQRCTRLRTRTAGVRYLYSPQIGALVAHNNQQLMTFTATHTCSRASRPGC